jgi:hypothetical protein
MAEPHVIGIPCRAGDCREAMDITLCGEHEYHRSHKICLPFKHDLRMDYVETC